MTRAMTEATRECSTLLRRVRRRTWNGNGRRLTVWVSRAEYERIEAMAEDRRVKRCTIASQLLRQGMKGLAPNVLAPPTAPAIEDSDRKLEVL